MQVRMRMFLRAYEPDSGNGERNGRKHHPSDPLLKQYEGRYGTDERGKAEEYAGPERT